MARLLWLALWRGRNQLPLTPAKLRLLVSRLITVIEYGGERPPEIMRLVIEPHMWVAMKIKQPANTYCAVPP